MRRLQHLSRDVGFSALLAGGAPTSNHNGFISATLPSSHLFDHEWVTVLQCPHDALTPAARRYGPTRDTGSYQFSHSTQLGVRPAHSLLAEVHLVAANRGASRC